MNSFISIHDMARQIFTAMNTRDFSGLEEIMDEEAVFDFPGVEPVEGCRKVIIFLKALLRKYPTLTFTVSEVIVNENRACAVWSNQGEHIDGHPYKNRGITLLHFSGKKINFISDYFKDTSFVK
jgi:ketosteroid isomerase-like protein